MKPGLEKRRNVPHHAAAVLTDGLTVAALNTLNDNSNINGCTGGCRTDSTGEWSERRTRVPWMTECTARSSELARKADSPRTERVSGK